MSEYDYDNDWEDEGEESSNGPAELRRALKKAQKELRETKSLLQEQTKSTRTRTIKDAIAAKGLNPKLGMLIPESVEATDEAVSAWLEDFSDVFSPASVQGEEAPASSEPSKGFYTQEERVAQDILGRANGQSGAPTGQADVLSQLEGANSIEDILRIAQGGSL